LWVNSGKSCFMKGAILLSYLAGKCCGFFRVGELGCILF
jgi:hypothetical protein